MGLLQGGCGRLIEVAAQYSYQIQRLYARKIGPLNTGWPLNTGPLYTGSTVYKCCKPGLDLTQRLKT